LHSAGFAPAPDDADRVIRARPLADVGGELVLAILDGPGVFFRLRLALLLLHGRRRVGVHFATGSTTTHHRRTAATVHHGHQTAHAGRTAESTGSTAAGTTVAAADNGCVRESPVAHEIQVLQHLRAG